MSAALTWLRANIWPVMLAIVALTAFRFGKQTKEVAHQKEKIDAQQDAIERQKKMAGANRHRPPNAILDRLRDGDA